MSMMTSRLNSARKSIARRTTRATASGSSPFTWKIGMGSIFATSVAYTVERDCSGGVVKPIWLLTTTCRTPPVS